MLATDLPSASTSRRRPTNYSLNINLVNTAYFEISITDQKLPQSHCHKPHLNICNRKKVKGGYKLLFSHHVYIYINKIRVF